MCIATIDIIWSPPNPSFADPPDRGGHLYQIYNHANGNRIHMSGSNGRGSDFDGTLRLARKIARDNSYTDYVFRGAPGYIWPLV